MSKSTSTFQFIEMFPDQDAGRVYLESRLWPDGPKCPVCGLGERITARKSSYYRCNQCKEDFTIRTGTVFERSHVPLNKWLCAMYLLVTARKGISSPQLSKEIGVTQRTAWFMLRRIREARGPDFDELLTEKILKALDAITDKVLAYRPKPKSAPAKKRKRKAAKVKRDQEIMRIGSNVI